MSKNQINWKLQFVELIVVILGISIAFSIDEWEENRRIEKRVTTSLQSFVADLEGDVKILKDFMIALNEEKTNAMKLIIDNIKNGVFEGDSISEAFEKIASGASTVINNTAYEEAKASGVFSSFFNSDLKKAIITHYYVNSSQVLFLSQLERGISDGLDNYLTHNFPIQFHADQTIPQLLKDMTFQNYLMRYYRHMRWKVSEYQRIQEQSEALLNMIQTEIDSRL